MARSVASWPQSSPASGASKPRRVRARAMSGARFERSVRPLHARVGGQRPERVRREVERHAAIAGGVLVAAMKALPVVAEQQRTGRHQRTSRRRAVLKRARHHDRDRHAGVLLLERPIVRRAGADHVLDAPARASGQHSPRRSAPDAQARTLVERRGHRGRKFHQDASAARVIQRVVARRRNG
jgi:hypothetical protein